MRYKDLQWGEFRWVPKTPKNFKQKPSISMAWVEWQKKAIKTINS